jgi:ATP-dependent DNA helicase RecQ
LRDPLVLIGGFDRPNIHLRVDRFEEEDKKIEAVTHQVRWADKPGIVYVGTRKAAEEIVTSLQEEGINALCYHAGLKGPERHEI